MSYVSSTLSRGKTRRTKSPANAKGWRITDATQEITVELLGTELVLRPQERDNTVYTLDGIRLFTPVDELSEGIYIIGGKKVIIDRSK